MIPYCAIVERADPAVSALVLRDPASPHDLLGKLLGVHDFLAVHEILGIRDLVGDRNLVVVG